MNSGPLFPGDPPEAVQQGPAEPAVQPEFRQHVEAWRQLLARCSRKPGRKSVHSLRVATLRLQAAAEFCLRDLEADSPDARALRRWQRQGNKLRRALGPVRQTDVYLGKLANLRSSHNGRADGQREPSTSFLHQIGELERRLAGERESAAKKLTRQIERRQRRLERLSRKMEAALAAPAQTRKGCSSSAISEQIAGLAHQFPELNDGTLHAYRKRIKKVRYLAEVSAPGNPGVARQAAALKRMATAAGEWHDWQTLAQEAAHVHRGHEGPTALARVLDAQAGKSLEEALTLCRRSMIRLLKPAANGHSHHEGAFSR